jgi:hypothetical protein
LDGLTVGVVIKKPATIKLKGTFGHPIGRSAEVNGPLTNG